MDSTVSQSVHAMVQESKAGRGPLQVHDSAVEIARRHGIRGNGIWLVEQAIVMVGSRAGVGMKIGRDPRPPLPGAATAQFDCAANSG